LNFAYPVADIVNDETLKINRLLLLVLVVQSVYTGSSKKNAGIIKKNYDSKTVKHIDIIEALNC
jgi:hypothetical protein